MVLTHARLNGRSTPHTIRVEDEVYCILDDLRVAMEKDKGRRVSLAEAVRELVQVAGLAVRRDVPPPLAPETMVISEISH